MKISDGDKIIRRLIGIGKGASIVIMGQKYLASLVV